MSSYQVSARKYRPQCFTDVVGQEHVTQALRHAIESGRIAHAYLFCGPRGTGKTTIARIFAMCLNCTGGPMAEFPKDDSKCVEIAEGRSLDVLEIDGADHLTAEGQARDRVRDEALARQGFLVRRIPGYEILREPERVLARIEECVRARMRELGVD